MLPEERRAAQGTLLILVSAVGFGTMAIFTKVAYAAGANVATTLLLRFLIASAVLWGGIAATRRSWAPLSGRALAACAGLGAVGYAAQSLTYFSALRYISASLGVLLLYTSVPIVTLLAVVFLGERLDRRKLLALTTAAAGLVLTLGLGVGAATGLGVALALAAAGVYSAYMVISRQMLRHVPPLAATAVVIPSAGVTFALYGGLSGQFQFALPLTAYLAIAGMAVVSTALAIAAFFTGLERVGASRAAILSTFEPVVTLSLGAALLGDQLTPVQILGGACIVGAVLLLHGAPAPSEPGR